MNKLILLAVMALLLVGCYYIPFTPVCERFPKDISYNGYVLHFGRGADLTLYRSNIGADMRWRTYTDFYWDTCGGITSQIIIMERMHELNEHGMWLPVSTEIYSSSLQMGVEQVRLKEGIVEIE